MEEAKQFIRIHMKDEKLDLWREKALLRPDEGKDEHIFLRTLYYQNFSESFNSY